MPSFNACYLKKESKGVIKKNLENSKLKSKEGKPCKGSTIKVNDPAGVLITIGIPCPLDKPLTRSTASIGGAWFAGACFLCESINNNCLLNSVVNLN